MKRLVTLEIPEGRLAEIFDRLHKAEQEISDCYNELRCLGVVTIQPPKQEGIPILPPPRGEKKTPKPHIGEHSCAGGSRVNLQTGAFIVSAILHQLMEGDNFKLVIEVADGTFVVNKYPMEYGGSIKVSDTSLDKQSLEQEIHDSVRREFENFCSPIHEPTDKATHDT